MDDAQLLAELEDCIRTMPPRERLNWDSDEISVWFGRATAIITRWDKIKAAALFRGYIDQIRDPFGNSSGNGINSMLSMLHEARFDLRMRVGPLSVAVDAGRPFEYFETIREVIAGAQADLLFVDRHLEGEFVSRYLMQAAQSVAIRLLTRDRVKQLVPAVALFRDQEQRSVEVRSHPDIHDRFVFVDRQLCYFSGASFKDGGRQSPALFSQIISCDAFIRQYEEMWVAATVELAA
jgi:hypothetical protein